MKLRPGTIIRIFLLVWLFCIGEYGLLIIFGILTLFQEMSMDFALMEYDSGQLTRTQRRDLAEMEEAICDLEETINGIDSLNQEEFSEIFGCLQGIKVTCSQMSKEEVVGKEYNEFLERVLKLIDYMLENKKVWISK